MSKKIAILGAGAWGLAVGQVLAEGNKVIFWSHSPVEELRETYTSPYLKNVDLHKSLSFSNSLEEVVQGRDLILIATPSIYTLTLVKSLGVILEESKEKPVIGILTKGFLEENGKIDLILPTLENHLPSSYHNELIYISGPSHAEEVARGVITGLVAASSSPKKALEVRDIMSSPTLKIYPSFDPIGVQVAGALKNAVAIAFGILDAFKERGIYHIGDNTESFLFAVGLNEIQTFGKALGSTHPETFSSIAGVGDLDVTCRSVHGRNRRFGRSVILDNILSNFTDIEDLKANMSQIGYMVEGIASCYYAIKIAEEKEIKVTLLSALYDLLNKKQEPHLIINSFLS